MLLLGNLFFYWIIATYIQKIIAKIIKNIHKKYATLNKIKFDYNIIIGAILI